MKPLKNQKASSEFVLRLETNPDRPIPFNMFGDLFIAHQKVVDLVARENGKAATIPELEVVRICEGSIEIHGAIQSVQMVAPFVKPLWGLVSERIKASFPGDDKIKFTETRTRELSLPRGLRKQLGDPIASGHLRSIIAEVSGEEVYKLDETNVPQVIEVVTPTLVEEDTTTERGESVSLQGELIEMNWKTRKGKVKTDFSGRNKQYDCYVEDDDFIQNAKTGLSTWILAEATPVYKVNPLGEKEVKLLLLNNLIIIKHQQLPEY